MLSFNDIPNNLRIPGAFIEFDNSLAGNASISHTVLVIAEMLAAGTATALVPVRVTRESQAEELLGRGSMGHGMIAAILSAYRFMDIWVLPVAPIVGDPAACTLTFAGDAAVAGSVELYVAGKRLSVPVSAHDTAATIGNAVAAAVTAKTELYVTASANAGVVTLTSRWDGETSNDIDVRLNYYGESLPSGITCVATTMSGGTGSPDLTTAIENFGDKWWNWIVCPYTDAANLVLLETELDRRYGPTEQKGARAFIAYRSDFSDTETFGDGRNSVHVSCMGTGNSPTPPWIWASVNAVIAGKNLAIDPARPLQTLSLPGVLPPAVEERWQYAERNSLLWAGISSYNVASDGAVQIERQITMYQENASGLEDDSYLNINTPETLERIRYEQRFMKLQKYPRHKLADDGTAFGPGQPITTPKLFKAELLSLYRSFIERGWCEGYESYADTLIVEKEGDRINYRDNPNLINQFRVAAGQNQFLN